MISEAWHHVSCYTKGIVCDTIRREIGAALSVISPFGNLQLVEHGISISMRDYSFFLSYMCANDPDVLLYILLLILIIGTFHFPMFL